MADNCQTSIPIQAHVGREVSRRALLLVTATLLAVPFVFFSTFTGMSWYDDEGTLLAGFRSLLDDSPDVRRHLLPVRTHV